VIDFSRAPSELFLSESIIPTSLAGFEEAKERTLSSIEANPFLRALSYAHLEEIIEDRRARKTGIVKFK
jgi:hypothetical protein